MKRGWIAASVVFLAMFGGVGYMASRLALFDALGPGPGFFPLILCVIGAFLAIALIGQIARAPAGFNEIAGADADTSLAPDRAASGRILSIVFLLAAAFLALDPLGYRLTALVFVALILIALGVRNMVAIALVSLVLSFGVFHSFYYWLKVPLPIGTLGI